VVQYEMLDWMTTHGIAALSTLSIPGFASAQWPTVSPAYALAGMSFGTLQRGFARSHGRKRLRRQNVKSKWSDRVPQVVEVDNKRQGCHRRAVNGKPLRGRGVCNCPALKRVPTQGLEK
jgi:hypothetical protein